MDLRPRGVVDGEHHALLGEWDPTDADHARLYAEEHARAEAAGRALLVVTFDPAPVSLLMGATARPPFDDVEARLAAQERCGVHSRVTVRLDRAEVDRAGVLELLDALAPHVAIAELVLGSGQTLGTQQRGNDATIRAVTAERGMTVRRLEARERRRLVADARTALARGRLARAVELVGRPLPWSRPAGGVLHLPWPPGRYEALPLTGPAAAADGAGRLEVVLRPDGRGASTRWPEHAPAWLGFVSGPADAAPTGHGT